MKLAIESADIDRALERVRQAFPPTPLTFSPILSEKFGREIFCKWDNKLRTGSFKERGASNVMQALVSRGGATRGICAASAGNHALALSFYAQRFKVPCTLVMPISAPLVKLQAAKSFGAEVLQHGEDLSEAQVRALELCTEQNLEFISPYDHPEVIAGQGTAGLELMDQLGDFDSVVVPVGGGGYAAGIALAIKTRRPEVFVLGCQSEWATHGHARNDMALKPKSLADGIAVKKIGKLTQPILSKYVDSLVAVSEQHIALGIVTMLEAERAVVEGAGAAGIAGLIANHLPHSCKRTIVMICGSNIDMNVLSRLLERRMAELGRLMRVIVSVPDRPGSLHFTAGLIASQGANVLEVYHDRSFSREPGDVDISFVLEVRDAAHKQEVLDMLEARAIRAHEVHV